MRSIELLNKLHGCKSERYIAGNKGETVLIPIEKFLTIRNVSGSLFTSKTTLSGYVRCKITKSHFKFTSSNPSA